MKITDRIIHFLNRFRSKSTSTIIKQSRELAAGRETVDHPYSTYRTNRILKAEDHLNSNWQMRFLQEREVSYMNTVDLLKLLSDVSPEFNRALHDFIQFVVTPGELVVDNPAGQIILDNALQTMMDKKEPFITKLEKAASSIFLHGAIFSELVLDPTGRQFSDLKIIDATLAQFRQVDDPVDGQGFELGQHKEGNFVSFQDDPTVNYMAFDPVPGSPFGRSLSAAAIFPLIFLLQMLKDLRQVIRTQGYPFKHATIDREHLKEGGIITEEEQNKVINEVKDDLVKFLEQDAGPYTKTPITGAEVDIKMVEGVGGGLQGIETLIQLVSIMVVRGLKTYPIIFGDQYPDRYIG